MFRNDVDDKKLKAVHPTALLNRLNQGSITGLIFIVYYVKNHYRKHSVNQFCLYFLHTALGAVF